jgi:hypothetical protein
MITDGTLQRFTHIAEVLRDAAKFIHHRGDEYRSEKWQGKETEPMHTMLSASHYSFQVPIPNGQDELLQLSGAQCPWAEDHFQERIGGKPLNPGNEYKNWKFYRLNKANDQYRTEDDKFTHTYMERFWPKHAWDAENMPPNKINRGIRYVYGDLNDVIALMTREPLTRQAFLPVWFPEDTGVLHGGRVPCTIGYHFQIRRGALNVTYYIRACDYFRHFHDDIYLAGRLGQHVLETLKEKLPDNIAMQNTYMGILTMHIADFHCFKHEKGMLRKIFEDGAENNS